MRPVVIEMVKGKPIVVSCPKKVQVIIREPKKRSLKKRIKTMVYQVKSFFGIQ
ncbi:hypothetical protein [Pseudoneobacillus rhizosphaerae]|uniref:Uncharacterized protein n=1 Tax=Pseudoneobacillus rhizosphaerae TaxID=2880968 RepID=A0A9C7G8R4_9BACI|nr:hypothetical protein [Pseudoneobacillus rhizosphaerae]CAG9608076.1 hypothetical protein NEOCIP111885_01768 [Pseudoneobacillus rhizosphaerae]